MKLSHNLVGINGVAPSATNPLPVRLTDGATFFSSVNPLPITGSVSVSNLPAIQVISGTVTANLGTIAGVATAANQATANASLSSIDGKLPALNSGRLPVDIGGNGSITITSGTVTVSNEVEIKNDSANPVPVSQAGTWFADFKSSQKDAFDRLITVSPVQLASFDHRVSKRVNDFDESIVGSATSTLNTATASVDLTTTTGATDSVVRQSYVSFPYTRGNSQQGMFSLNLNDVAKANNTRLFGLGDSENGAFIGVDGTGLFVMRRSKTSGVVVDTKTYQASFSHDKLDGTGESGITLDLTKHNLFTITYSWLGTNAILYTLTVGGVKHLFHVDQVGNALSTAWCQSGQLPLRFENTNTGATASSTTFKVGCSAVVTFGAPNIRSVTQSVSSGTTAITLTTAEKVCAGIRLRSGLKYVAIEPIDYQIMPTSGNGFAYYKVILRPTLTGATWANQGDISEILTNNPTYTGGIVLQEGFLNLSTTGRLAVEIPATLETTLGYSLAGVPDSLIVVIRTDAGTGSVYFSGAWKEIY